MHRYICWFLVFNLFFAINAEAKVKVIDGDSLILNNQEIRLSGIDAPEYKQYCFDAKNQKYPCGILAKKALEHLLDENLTCQTIVVDKYKRLVSVCYAKGHNVNKKMVENGWAIAYKRYTSEYNQAEKKAQKHKRGIWQGRFIRPELYRILNKK